jgi:hypothetical protein
MMTISIFAMAATRNCKPDTSGIGNRSRKQATLARFLGQPGVESEGFTMAKVAKRRGRYILDLYDDKRIRRWKTKPECTTLKQAKEKIS